MRKRAGDGGDTDEDELTSKDETVDANEEKAGARGDTDDEEVTNKDGTERWMRMRKKQGLVAILTLSRTTALWKTTLRMRIRMRIQMRKKWTMTMKRWMRYKKK